MGLDCIRLGWVNENRLVMQISQIKQEQNDKNRHLPCFENRILAAEDSPGSIRSDEDRLTGGFRNNVSMREQDMNRIKTEMRFKAETVME